MIHLQHKVQLSTLLASILALSSTNQAIAGANFQIIPASGHTFPTKVVQGQAVSAYL